MKVKNHSKTVKKYDLEFKVTSVTHSKDAGGECLIEGYANTASKDRVGDVVLPTAFEKSLPLYLKNPVLLANHDWNDPCGRVLSAEVTDKGLFIRARISDTREDIKTLIREGCLSTFSIGYNEVEADYDEASKTKYIKELELLEISIVTVPANAEATFAVVDQKTTDGKGAKPKSAKSFKEFVGGVIDAVGRELKSNEVIAIGEYFNENEDIMTKDELIKLLRGVKSDPAAAPAAAASGSAPAASGEGAKADDEAAKPAGDDMLKQVMAKLDAIAQGLAQLLEGGKAEGEKPKEDEKPKDEKPKEEGKEGEGADGEKAKCPECEGKGDECKCDDEKSGEQEMTEAELNAEIAAIDAEIADLEDADGV